MKIRFLNQKEQNLKSQNRRSLIARFARNTDGNLAIMFMLMSITLFMFIGGAVDYTRWNSVRTDMVESMDAASLALARYAQDNPDLTDAELQAFGKQFFDENFNYEQYIYKPNGDPVTTGESLVTFNLSDDAVVSACIQGRLNTYLLRVASIKYFTIDQCVEITKFGRGRVELALVLDVTGSMDRDENDNYTSNTADKKITKLKDAVTNMLDVMFGSDSTSQNVQIGIVPFNAYVNAGGATSWQAAWEDSNAESAYHGAHFFHVTEGGEIDMDTKVNHFRLFDSTPNEEWEGCVEARPYPLDELDTPPGSSTTTAMINTYNTAPAGTTDSRTLTAFSRAPALQFTASELASVDNSRFVPMFAPDEPDCDSGWNGRCPYYGGYSWWNESQTISISGVNTTVNYARYWFTDPSDDGWNRFDYDNDNFIDDEQYTGRNQGEPTARYAYIVKKFRNLKSGSGSTGPQTTDEQNWKTWLATIGASTYFDTDINIEHTAFADDYANHAYDYSIANYDEYVMRNAYVGWWNSSTNTYDYKYDQPRGSSSVDGPNRRCPVEILPLTNVRLDIEDHMALLSPDGNTNTAIGTVWGWRVVSDAAPFTEASANDDNDWQKAVVIMTDGSNTTGWRDTPWGTDLTSYGYGLEERMGVGVNVGGGDSNWDSDEMRDHMNEKMLRTCARMKEEGILVYTIVFGLNNSTTEAVFQSCATEPNAPYYYKAPTGDELAAAFGDIAADLVDLHISE